MSTLRKALVLVTLPFQNMPSLNRAELNLLVVAIACLGTLSGCAQKAIDPIESDSLSQPVVTSLLGKALTPPTLSPERRTELEANLASARTAYDADPSGEENIIWLGRRLAYLSRYQEAIDVFTKGLDLLPESHRLLRHRGHRYISTRRFELAVSDLRRAAELSADHPDDLEPDGIPNRLNRPLSTTRFNIWYHLGLAHYLLGDFESALVAYDECMKVSNNPDLMVATSDWMYMTLRRLGRHDQARALLEPITADLEVIENDSYHRRLLMYKGELSADDLLDLEADDDPDTALQIATQGYGVGNWFLVEEDQERATEIFKRILEGTSWAAFGYIAAEAELARASR